MTRRFFGASKPNHDGDFLRQSDHITVRWGGSTDGQPSNPHRRGITGAERHWNGPNPLEIGHEANTPNRRYDAPPQTMGKAASHTTPPSWRGSTDAYPSDSHRRIIADAGHHWNGSIPSEIGHKANKFLRRHDALARTNKGKASPHIIPPSSPHGVPGFILMSLRGHIGRAARATPA